MKRWHEDKKITLREWRKHRKTHVEDNIRRGVLVEGQRVAGADPFQVECTCDDQIGRFRKVDAFDCGIPHCNICHYAKYPKRELSMREIKSNWDFKQQMREFD